MIYVKLGFKNVWRQRRRNIFSLLAIIVGTSSLINLGGYINRWEYRGLYNSVYVYRLGTVTIYKKDGLRFGMTNPKQYTLSPDEQVKIREYLQNDKRIEAIGSALMMGGLASNGCVSFPFEVTAYDPQLNDVLHSKDGVRKWSSDLTEFKKGLPFTSYQEKDTVGLAIGLGKLLGKETSLLNADVLPPIIDLREYCHGNDTKNLIAKDPNLQLLGLTFDGQFGAIDVDIAHFYTTGIAITEDTKMTAPLATIQDLFQTKNVTTMSVYFDEHSDAESKAREMELALNELGLDVETYAWTDERVNAIFTGPMAFLYVMSAFFGFLILGIVVLSVINLTMMNVFDRSREIGTLKAIGYRQDMVAKIFFFEGFVIAAVGCLSGLILSLITSTVVNSSAIMFLPPGASEPIPLLIIPGIESTTAVLSSMFILVTAASLLTSYLASRRSCLELLTHHSN